MNLASIILNEVDLLDHETPINKEIFTSSSKIQGNEFLLILKPELLTDFIRPKLQEILQIIVQRLTRYQLTCTSARIINAKYLSTQHVMAKHYGVINAAARDFQSMISPEVSANFKNIYGLEISEATVYGALELLNNNTMDADTLNVLWKDCEIKRLAGGIYSGKVNFKDADRYIVNGFHPPQLEHFIADKRMIVTMNIAGNASWEMARNEMIGNTYPEKASTESIRGALYHKYGKFGFDHVSYVLNSVHLSAGPLEGLIELQRFNTTIEQDAQIDSFLFGRMLRKKFNNSQVQRILENPTVIYNGKPVSLFDLTELTDSNQAIDILNEVIAQI